MSKTIEKPNAKAVDLDRLVRSLRGSGDLELVVYDGGVRLTVDGKGCWRLRQAWVLARFVAGLVFTRGRVIMDFKGVESDIEPTRSRGEDF